MIKESQPHEAPRNTGPVPCMLVPMSQAAPLLQQQQREALQGHNEDLWAVRARIAMSRARRSLAEQSLQARAATARGSSIRLLAPSDGPLHGAPHLLQRVGQHLEACGGVLASP